MRELSTLERIRASKPLATALHASDSYGLLLVALLGWMVASALEPSTFLGHAVYGLYNLAVIALAAHTSQAPGRMTRRLVMFAALLELVALVAIADGDPTPTGTHVAALGLGAITFGLVARRLRQHGMVSTETVLGGICMYLIIGLLFTQLYVVVASVDTRPFFAGHAVINPFDYLYFSIVTMTTLGYGDYTAATSLGRALAMMEALLGQVFLITAVAWLVTQWRGAPRPDS